VAILLVQEKGAAFLARLQKGVNTVSLAEVRLRKKWLVLGLLSAKGFTTVSVAVECEIDPHAGQLKRRHSFSVGFIYIYKVNRDWCLASQIQGGSDKSGTLSLLHRRIKK